MDPAKPTRSRSKPEGKPKGTRSRSKPKDKPADDLNDDLGLGDNEVSIDDLKAAVHKRIEADESQDGVKAVFAEFGAKKLSDIGEDDYPKVLAALQADDDDIAL